MLSLLYSRRIRGWLSDERIGLMTVATVNIINKTQQGIDIWQDLEAGAVLEVRTHYATYWVVKTTSAYITTDNLVRGVSITSDHPTLAAQTAPTGCSITAMVRTGFPLIVWGTGRGMSCIGNVESWRIL